ncbi:MAG: SIR2 family protein [Pseudomonadota bacterium]
MENVVYILGAGFSAPLGLPVMSNFISKSKDLYFEDKEKYPHFSSVFSTMRELASMKSYYSADLLNIEEVLSIIEMVEFVNGESLGRDFIQYISDVVNAHTPELPTGDISRAANWYDIPFGHEGVLSEYCYFVSSLLGISLFREQVQANIHHPKASTVFRYRENEDRGCRYSILSLNYDQVIENCIEYISRGYKADSEDAIGLSDSFEDLGDLTCQLFKLHGCSRKGNIIPPTWAKGTHKNISEIWKGGFRALREANHIRFVGYSLPVSDSYFKYFLKAAMSEADHIKSIDALCLDYNGAVKARFDDFIDFPSYRFASMNVRDYFSLVKKNTLTSRSASADSFVRLNGLERSHDEVFADKIS